MKTKNLNTLSLVLKQTAVAAAALFFLSAGGLVYIYSSGTVANIKDSPALERLKQKLEKEPANEALIKSFREVDLQERALYFGKSELLETGAKICLVFLMLFLISQRGYSLLNGRIPKVKKGSESNYHFGGSFKSLPVYASASLTGILVVMILFLLSVMGSARFPWQAEKSAPVKGAELNKQWNGFRGLNGRESAAAGNYASIWNIKSNKNIAWKTSLPVKGYSSPIVYEDKLFITGSENKKLRVLCYAAATGNLNWSSPVLVTSKQEEAEVMTEEEGGAGYCAPTPVTDGEYVYAYFATNKLVCFNLAGKQQWLRDFGKPENIYGLSASPVLFEDKIIIQADQGEEGLSRIYAVNKKTGKIEWETKRPDGASWGTPLVIDYRGRKEIITTTKPWVIAYAPASGKELWKAECLSGEVSTSASFSDGKIYVMSPDSQTSTIALLPGGTGDVTRTNIAWKMQEDSQAINAPAVLDTKIVIALKDNIVMRASTDGKIVWQYKTEDEFWASPVIAGKKLYLSSRGGKVYVLTLEGKLVNTMDMGEEISASPAFQTDKIFLRTNKNLYCLKEEKK